MTTSIWRGLASNEVTRASNRMSRISLKEWENVAVPFEVVISCTDCANDWPHLRDASK